MICMQNAAVNARCNDGAAADNAETARVLPCFDAFASTDSETQTHTHNHTMCTPVSLNVGRQRHVSSVSEEGYKGEGQLLHKFLAAGKFITSRKAAPQ